MITHPTRTNLLLLKDKSRSVLSSVGILRARRQALIKEFLAATRPFLKSREEIRGIYGKAIEEVRLSLGREGRDVIESITYAAKREIGVEITERSIWGLRYRDVISETSPIRKPEERGYDYTSTTGHVEEGFYLFEKIVESMLELASFESKLKRLGEEILKTSRKIRVLEERLLPELKGHIRSISQHIGEREREVFYRLKRFKNKS